MKKILNSWLFWLQAFLFLSACVVLFTIVFNYRDVLDGIRRFLGIVSPFIIGAVIAYFLSGPCNFFEKLFSNPRLERTKFRFLIKRARGVSVFVVYILTIAILAVIGSFFLPLIIQNLIEFINTLPQIYLQAQRWANSFEWEGLNEVLNVEEQVQAFFDTFTLGDVLSGVSVGLNTVGNFAITTAVGILDAFVAVVISVYALLYKRSIFAMLNWATKILIKEKRHDRLKRYMIQANDLFYRFIRAQFLDACILGVLAMILLRVIGVNFAVTLGVFLGICNMIPKFGSIFGTAVVVVLSLMTGGSTQAILVAIFLTILQQIDGNIIGPKIMGKALKINPILVFLALVIGGAYAGVIGMFVSIPVMAMAKIIFMNLMLAREKKGTGKVDVPEGEEVFAKAAATAEGMESSVKEEK